MQEGKIYRKVETKERDDICKCFELHVYQFIKRDV